MAEGWAELKELVRGSGAVVAEIRFPFCSSDWYLLQDPDAVDPVQARVGGNPAIPVHGWALNRVETQAGPVAEGVLGTIRASLNELESRAWLLLRVRKQGATSWHTIEDDDAFEAAVAAADPDGHVTAWDAGALSSLAPDVVFRA